jgi:hypothetical protein
VVTQFSLLLFLLLCRVGIDLKGRYV